jgi:para-aminobenzoate synthetase component 1
MKGTIDASIKDAKEKILDNKKELAEHTMAVDLLRNDLNMVSKDVKLEKFRYISKLETDTKILYQVSSKISGNLGQNWQNRVGDILDTLLPAGSISGTPKKMSIKLIEEIEEHSRDWFSGVFGYFDGVSLDSAVMIRYMQKDGDDFIYKSGGGITISSDIDSEYNEMKDKVYIPK